MRKLILAGALSCTMAVAPADAAYIATQRQVDAAELLIPFTTLNLTAAGRATLDQNLATSIAINNMADAITRAQAVSDIAITTDYGAQFTVGLGSRIDTAYQAAVLAGTDPRLATSGAIVQGFRTFTGLSGADSAFDKTFFANGKFNNSDPVANITLPQGGVFNTYDMRYLPQDPTNPAIPLNPNGDSRPYQVRPDAIDQFALAFNSSLTTNSAFPSGHTTYGFTEGLMEALAVPERFAQELTRASEYGYSRVVVGAHYALDVIGGRILATHDLAQELNNDPAYTGGADLAAKFQSFTDAFRGVIASSCGASVAACAASPDASRFASYAKDKADYTYRLTYGLPATGPTNLAAVVPVGAEVLLASRFPYLSAEQRREVLATTEIASGAPLDDGSGWARLNLFAAGGGYGAFNGQVVVNQDASKGGFNASDAFLNDIDGAGGLTHTGTGTLALYGANSYAGGTTVAGGTIVAASDTALGTGDVALTGGTLQVTAPSLEIGGSFSESADSILSLAELGAGDPLVDILGRATLGGTLLLDFSGFASGNGVYEILSYGGYSGRFGTVSYANLGDAATRLDYRANGLFLSVSGVPEPGTWAMMILGFGAIGSTLRRRRKDLTPAL